LAEDTTAAHADEEAVGDAVRDYMRSHALALLERKGLANSPELETCPRCGERTIHPGVAATFAIDRRDQSRICAACAAVGDVMKIMLPRFEVDVGGEGEGGG
jgi:recombinational DNA repair protein (RecF pathway)